MKKTCLAVLLVLTIKTFCQSTPSYVSTNCLLGWWPFTGNANDASINSFNGTVNSAVLTNDRFNNANSAYRFNGTNSFIQVTNAAALSGFQDLTISAWVKPSSLGTGARGIVTKWYQSGGCTPGTNKDTYAMTLNGNTIPCGTSQGGGIAPAGLVISDTARYNHIVYISKASAPQSQKIYLNGVMIATGIQGGANICNTINNLFFGCDNNGGSPFRYFNGALDDIGIWCRALDTCEIFHLYNASTLTCAPIGPQPPSSNTSCCLGNPCGQTQNPLASNYQIPLNNFNFNFSVPGGNKSQVLIGYPNCTSTLARLDVKDDNNGMAIKGFCSTSTQNNFGVHGEAIDGSAFPGANLTSVGVEGVSNQVRYPLSKQIGVAGFCGGSAIYPSGITGQNIGVYGNSTSNGGVWAGYFDGNVGFNGNALPIGACSWNVGMPGSEWNEVWACNGTIQTSDKRKKDNIQSLEYGIKEIMKLNPVSFTWKSNSSGGRKIGFIAQELKEVISEVVKEGTDENKTMGVNYAELTALLVKGIQEQQEQINTLKQENLEMKKQISSGTGLINFTNLETGFQMSQNEPNPFTHETVVKYTLPTTVSNAFMAVYDLTGKQITTFPIDQKGSSSLTITSEKLAAGIYIYSIVADGKIVDSKRMIVAEK